MRSALKDTRVTANRRQTRSEANRSHKRDEAIRKHRPARSGFQMFGGAFNNLNLSFRERARGGFVDLEREWRDFLRVCLGRARNSCLSKGSAIPTDALAA